ncbi:hypothetical protein GCK72_003944 [Caenorhabditis remanei]|uniref:RING-type domain-containing protein n=1 Tax=Caenorhabditis remanei TaxID=31234 RepID=A0A6A5H8D8_CAERE|nr:hypothetical protein GCK72_003944 [Caenorhabditis remanei]KAF1763998.1 hypothetical protein GCK72_003944 [Caenorhabditis remanei]
MAQFLKCPHHVFDSNKVYHHVYLYILPELRPFLPVFESIEPKKLVYDDGEEVIQRMLDKSNNQLRMYGSAKEIAENLKIFRNFSESFRLFQSSTYPFNASALIYESLSGNKYICKPDIYTIIHNIALHTIDHADTVVFHVVLTMVLKPKIMLIDGHVEFVKFDEKMFDEIEKEMREVAKKSHQQASAQRNNLEKLLLNKNYAAIVSKLRELNPTTWNDVVTNSYLEQLQSLSQIGKQKEFIFAMVINSYIMKCIEQIVTEQAPLLISTPESSPITVRLFEDGEERYVMEEELYHALNRLSTGSKRFEIQNNGFVHKGMSFKEVKAEFGDQIQKIEFIRTPILRSKHRAVPIRSHFPEQFVIPAVDFFLEFFKQIIFGLKVFQKYQSSDWKNFAPIFKKMEEIFYSDQKHQYFLRADDTLDISQQTSQLEKYEVSPVKKVRNAKSDGFTAQNLKNELKYLGLTYTFPEIQEYAEAVYEGIDMVKKEGYLRTCDLFDAVENCQLICILNRVPNLKMFLHNQKGCKRVFGYKCEHCEKEKKTSDALEINQQPAEVLKTSDVQKSLENQKIESLNKPIPNRYSQPALSASQICEKCSESSAILVETQNELKMSKDQLKEMEKKVLDKEKELSDLKKEHDILVESEAKKTEELAEMKEELNNEKKNNQEKEEEILKAKGNEELQKIILQLKTENEANERVIQNLLDRISNLSSNNKKTHQINEKTIEESTPIASVSSKNAPLVIDCLICSSQIKSGQEVIRCPLCKRRFHSNCAFKWRKDHTQCPACNGDLPGI